MAMTVTSGDIDKLLKAFGVRLAVPKLLWRLVFSDQSDVERTSKHLRYCILVVVLFDLRSHDYPQLTTATAACGQEGCSAIMFGQSDMM